jgi:hypothetical protein
MIFKSDHSFNFYRCYRPVFSVLVSLVVLATFCAVEPANAGNRDFWPPLTKKDMELLKREVSNKLENAEPGAEARWANKDSGNRGTITLTRLFKNEQRPCRELLHVIKLKSEELPRRLTLTACKNEAGEWQTR